MSTFANRPPYQQESPAEADVRAAGQKSRLPGWAHSWWSSTLDTLFPPACLICDEQLPDTSERNSSGPLLCLTCQQAMQSSWEKLCARCGNPWNSMAGVCPCQRDRKLRFGRVVALGLYSDRLRDAVLKIKKPIHDALAINLTRLLWDAWSPALADLNIGLVVPVPVSPVKRVFHGRGSSEVIAEELARRLNCRWQRGVVRRKIGIPKQSSLPLSQRSRNARRAFLLASRYDMKSVRVLLVDDVMTSGATCNTISRLLLKAGAASVDVAVLARAMNG